MLVSLVTFVLKAQVSISQTHTSIAKMEILDFNEEDSEPYFLRDSSTQNKILIAYEIGEAIFNRFQSLSGEIGVRFKNQQILRLAYVNLNLTEQHLSSDFARAVNGENVKGKQLGYELFYDFPVFFKDLYVSPSIGYYHNEYEHTILKESLENSSLSIGTAISYRETNIFNTKGLYYAVSIPMRINLNPIEETNLGTATISNSTFDNNIWLFIGYQF